MGGWVVVVAQAGAGRRRHRHTAARTAAPPPPHLVALAVGHGAPVLLHAERLLHLREQAGVEVGWVRARPAVTVYSRHPGRWPHQARPCCRPAAALHTHTRSPHTPPHPPHLRHDHILQRRHAAQLKVKCHLCQCVVDGQLRGVCGVCVSVGGCGGGGHSQQLQRHPQLALHTLAVRYALRVCALVHPPSTTRTQHPQAPTRWSRSSQKSLNQMWGA